MDYQVIPTEALLFTELAILILFGCHILKLEKYNRSLIGHIKEIDDHVNVLASHIEKLEKHIDALDDHSKVIDFRLKTILDYSKVQTMEEEKRKEFIEGVERYFEKKENG